jgi:hypothetical protein
VKRTRLSVCRAKRTFGSDEEAQAAALAFGLDLRPYRCDRCRAIHLTSRRKGKRVPRPERFSEFGEAGGPKRA